MTTDPFGTALLDALRITCMAITLIADAIVIGTHGHTTAGEVVLGSTAHRVARKSPVPVLLVRVAESDTDTGF